MSEKDMLLSHIEFLSDELSIYSGKTYFDKMGGYICDKLDIDYVFVGIKLSGQKKVKVIGGWGDGSPVESFIYELAGTPCENVLEKGLCFYPEKVATIFPDDLLLKEMEIESYMGEPLFDKNKIPIGIMVFLNTHEISNPEIAKITFKVFRNSTQAELLKMDAEERYKLIFDNALDPIYIADKSRKVIDCNEAALKMLGYTKNEIKSLNIDDIDYQEYHGVMKKNIKKQLQTGRAKFETVHRKKNGELVPVEVNSNFVKITEDEYLIGIARDLTERKLLEQKLIETQKLESLGRIAGGIAHDFNNILATIVSFLEVLKMGESKNSPNYEIIGKILNSASRGAELVKQLLRFARKSVLNITNIFVISEIRLILSMFERVLTKKPKITFKHHDKVLLIKGDHSLFEQIISNLLINANDAVSDFGEISISAEVILAENDNFIKNLTVIDSEWVKITFTDNGVGIPKEHIDKIFEPFFTTKQIGKGTGLGLANVYGSVKQMGGYIFVESKLNVGTSFYIYFPSVYDKNISKEKQKEYNDSCPELRLNKRMNVLLVDDEEAFGFALKNLLNSPYINILYANNGPEGFKIFMDNKIDMLITDIMMPGMKGDLLADMCRAINEKLKVIFITGNPSETDEKNVLTKPFKREQLFLMINKMFEDEL